MEIACQVRVAGIQAPWDLVGVSYSGAKYKVRIRRSPESRQNQVGKLAEE
jgi:hypothetical protein